MLLVLHDQLLQVIRVHNDLHARDLGAAEPAGGRSLAIFVLVFVLERTPEVRGPQKTADFVAKPPGSLTSTKTDPDYQLAQQLSELTYPITTAQKADHHFLKVSGDGDPRRMQNGAQRTRKHTLKTFTQEKNEM